MKIIYQDLLAFLSEKPSKEVLSEKLFQLGHEHEIIGDIFDMELTPNRGDCLSLMGLARDLNIFFGQSDDLDIYEGCIEPLELDFENLSPSDCPKISFLEIEIEEIKPGYEPYLENYFNKIGNNKTNLFTDISNYISYELGQPTHCFDKELIDGKLVFENKECKSRFKTLVGSEIDLKDTNCVFSIDDKIISLAGVMGGASSACSKKTKKALVECAYFNPESIIGKSIKYNLVSDAAHKFERGVDIQSQEKVLRRFIKIVQDHAKINQIQFKCFSPRKFQNLLLPFDLEKINKILGTQLKKSEYINYLKSLQFGIDSNIQVPSYRSDIKTQNDLAEEIARLIGYDNINSSPVLLKKTNEETPLNKIFKIESFLINNGFTEVINFPFTSKKDKESLKIDNPLDSNRDNFRVSLMDSLLQNLIYNERRQKESIKLFEISHIYRKDKGIKQQKKLGIIGSGKLANNYRDFSKKIDHNYFNELFNTNIKNNFFEISEISRNSINSKKKDKIFYIEVLIDDIPDIFFDSINIQQKSINFFNYKPISEYPSSTRDFSFSISNVEKLNEVIESLDGISDEIIKDSFIFDFYNNTNTNSIKLGYKFIFQSHQKTLSDEEINKKAQEILSPILKIDGVSIPGM